MKFNIIKTNFEISYLFVCLISICLILGAFQEFLICLTAVILHEIGHIIPMCIFGHRPKDVKITLFQITIKDNNRTQASFWQNLIIIISGPLINFVCYIFFFLLYLFCNKCFIIFAITNVSVGVFNMLPVLSLDGGQLLFLILSKKFSLETSEKVVNIITFIFIFPISALGFLVLFSSKYNFSLLFVSVYLIMALVCKNNKYY